MRYLKTLPPLSLYVHLPWCVRKCPYCDFNSHQVRGGIPEDAYVDALISDLDQSLVHVAGRPIISVFIGGGTPSLFRAKALERLLTALRARLSMPYDMEITLEANPGTVEAKRFRGYRALGINRLSLGVQSFDDKKLRQLGRIHSGQEALSAIRIAQNAGFENLNLDLMFGLPGHDEASAINDLKLAIECAPAHLSWYQLTIEPNTVFHRHPPLLPEDDVVWAIQIAGQALLAEHGYRQYEVSAYAASQRSCVHNLNYWQFGDYLGIGAGAHSKITTVQGGQITRFSKRRQPSTYLARAGTPDVIDGKRVLTRDDVVLEFMMNALRLTQGFETALFADHTGFPVSAVAEELRTAKAKKLIEWDEHRIRPTELGKQFLNDLLCLFLRNTAPEKVIV
ncbi:MAG: radical SAM family heme chaperone HemW [Gammaproteobacteria bacterium]|nr:radical SAM family heme chaperone HemW [Gammaproteobacteria bacterium]MCI0590423.1 radical SAM family heme chaperone HemW [Gammaproteobacteria bacterium]